jgi:hypothetical protein
MAKKKTGPKKPEESMEPGKSEVRVKKSILDKFRAIDQSSIASLILSRVASEPDGISTSDLTENLMSDVRDSVAFHLKNLQTKNLIVPDGELLAFGGGKNLIRTLVCLTFCDPPGAGIDEDEVIKRVRRLNRDVTPADVRIVLTGLRKGSDCVTYKDGLYSRDCTVDCSCD